MLKAKDEIMYLAMLEHKELFDKYLREKYEEEHGPHFNEEYAKEAVSRMYANGESGEHWSIEQVKSVTQLYREYMKESDTCWDIYVALHMWYYDLGKNYKKRGSSDSWLIDDAMVWSFCDEDAKEGKIWHYINAMK